MTECACPREQDGINNPNRRALKLEGNMDLKVNVIYAFCPELEGCHTQGDTLEEVLENIREAVEL